MKEKIYAVIINDKMEFLLCLLRDKLKEESSWILPNRYKNTDESDEDVLCSLMETIFHDSTFEIKEKCFEEIQENIHHKYYLIESNDLSLAYSGHVVSELSWWSKNDFILSQELFFTKDKVSFIHNIHLEELETKKYERITEKLNANSRFLRNNNMKIISLSDGLAKVELDVSDDLFNVHGFVHGGAMFSLADNTAGAAAFSKGRECVTLTGNINYIKPGRSGKLLGVAHEVSCGRTTGVYDVHIFSDEGKLLAKATFTMFFLDKKF